MSVSIFKHVYIGLLSKCFTKNEKIKRLNIPEKPVIIDGTSTFLFPENICIKKYARIGPNCHLDGEGKLEIGKGTILAPNIAILSSSHSYDGNQLLPYDENDVLKGVRIGAGVWIGFGAIILPGVTISDGAVVAAGSVVAKDIPSGAVVAGNPARIIKKRKMDCHEISELVDAESFYIKAMLRGDVSRNGRKTKPSTLIE